MNDLDDRPSFYAKHLFGMMVVGSVLMSLVLVAVSMGLYYSSGASQLDLSSPNYVDIRDQIEIDDNTGDFSNIGSINQDSIDEFEALYSEKVIKAKSIDVFGGSPLSAESLGIADGLTIVD